MINVKRFIRQSLIGGVLVLLPLVIFGFVVRWAFYFVTDLIQPITDYLLVKTVMPELMADFLVMLIIVLACFLIGSLVSTGIGKWLHGRFDRLLARLAPGYKLIKEIVGQFFGDPNASPFSKGEVVIAKLFGPNCPTTVTGIVTARHPGGLVTIFMPTGPNPTSGNIYHLPESSVTVIEGATVEQMMRTIIGCGAGSDHLFALNKEAQTQNIEHNHS